MNRRIRTRTYGGVGGRERQLSLRPDTPISPVFTEVVLTWLVHEDAVEGEDYDVEHLKWMWDVTTIQDTRIINDNQKGVNSTRYGPGRYSLRESGSAFFSAWYLSRLNGSEMPDPATLNPGFW